MAIADRVEELLPQLTEENVSVANYVASAIAVFSRYYPKETVEQITVTGSTYTLSLPSGWEQGFSRIISIEWPLDKNPPEYIPPEAYAIYRSASGEVIKLARPVDSDVLVTYTKTWTESDLSAYDAESVALLACALVCDQLVAKYAGSVDDVIQTAAGLWRTKSAEYASAKKNFLHTFTIRTGIDLDTGKAAPATIYQRKYMPRLVDMDIARKGWFFDD